MRTPDQPVRQAWWRVRSPVDKWVASILLVGLVVLASLVARISSAAPPTFKIGLIAPFEGEFRNTGYEMLFAVKLALQERNQNGGLNGYRVELVALNDFSDPEEAKRQAEALVADPDVIGVVGHSAHTTTAAALPVYQAAALPLVIPWSVEESMFQHDYQGLVSVAATKQEAGARLQEIIAAGAVAPVKTVQDARDLSTLTPDTKGVILDTDAVTAGNLLRMLPDHITARYGHVDVGNRQLTQVADLSAEGVIFVSPGPDVPDIVTKPARFAEVYQAAAGLPPGPRAILAYDATHFLLDTVEETMNLDKKWYNKTPQRSIVSQTLTARERQGLSGYITVNEHGQRLNAPVWIYQIDEMRYPGTPFVP